MRSYWQIIGQAIREARQETEESQRNTALRLGIKPSDYCKMEDGEDNPDVVLDALMRALRERDKARKERDQLKEALVIMENLLKPGIELFPEIGEILKRGAAK